MIQKYQKLLDLYHNIEKYMSLLAYVQRNLNIIHKKIKNYLGKVVLKKLSQKPNDDDEIVPVLNLLIHVLETGIYTDINIGWNSSNSDIITKCDNIQEDITELIKINLQIEKRADKRISTRYLTNDDKCVNVCLYFRDRKNNFVNTNDTIKTLTSHAVKIIRRFNEIDKDPETKMSYEHSVLKKILQELQKTLTSLSNLK